MAAKVLQELDQLRSMLRPDCASYMPAPVEHGSGESSMRPYVGCSASSTTEKSVDRLGRAIEAAEEEVEAAMRRTTDIHRSQLRHKDLEVAELQRLLSSTQQTADGLRQSLTTTKRSYQQKLQHLEASLQLRDVEQLATLRAELIAIQADRDNLTLRSQQDLSTISRLEAELVKHTEEFSSSLQAERGAAAQVAATAARERQDKADTEHDRRCELEVLLDKATAAADIIREAKDLEIAELRRRVKAEHGVRKACERWLRSELQSREEMEGLLLAMKAMLGEDSKRLRHELESAKQLLKSKVQE
eukprot:gene9893-10050_t